MLRFFHRTWLFLSILSFGSAFIPPKLLWLAGVWTFTIPIFGIGLFVFLLVYLLRREKRSLLYTLLVFLLGIPHWLATVNFSFSTDESGTDLKVLSYNLHYFYSADKLRFVPEQRETFMAFIKNEQPDFLCLQEFHDPGQRLSKWLQKKGYTNQRFLWIRPGRGLAIFSRFPITSYQETSFENSPQNGCQQVNIDLQNGKSLSLVNVHLQSFILRNFNKMRLRKVNDLIHALGQGMIHQSEQVEWLLSENKSNTSAILICGDHNSTPYSYVYRRLRREYSNAFEDKGRGLGITYQGRLPFLRIDHHFYNAELEIRSFRVASEIQISDHLPLIGVYRL